MIVDQTAESIAKAAYNGHEPDGCCDLSDFHMHTCLSQLYADFKGGKITKEQAEALKLKLVAAWKSDKALAARWDALTSEHADAIKRTATMNPEKAKTQEECIGILAEMVAAVTGDSSLPNRLKNKVWE